MKIAYEVAVLFQIDVPEGKTKGRVEAVDLLISAPPFIEKQLKLPEGSFTKQGHHAATDALVHGLIANIHSAHQAGDWKSHEHLQHIMKMLEKGFAFAGAEAGTGLYGERLTSPSDGAQTPNHA
jgi:methylase of polypeptide subunit release factors